MKQFKRIIALCLVLVVSALAIACGNDDEKYKNAGKLEGGAAQLTGAPELDFVEMHNFVIDSITSQYTPFFYIAEGKFDISGDNDKKKIKITCTCIDGTVRDDLDLFLSMVMNYMAANASEQDFRFKAPAVDKEGTYTDFGNLFDYYDLEIYSTTESGTVLRNDYIKAGEKLPIDPKYIKE